MWAVVLVGALTLRALEACPDLRADSNTVANFDLFHVLADRYRLANDLVADAQWALIFSPAASDRVPWKWSAHCIAAEKMWDECVRTNQICVLHVTAAYATSFNLNVNVIGPKRLWL